MESFIFDNRLAPVAILAEVKDLSSKTTLLSSSELRQFASSQNFACIRDPLASFPAVIVSDANLLARRVPSAKSSVEIPLS